MKQLRYPGRQGIETNKPPVKKRYFGSWKVGRWFWGAFAAWLAPAFIWGLLSAHWLWSYDLQLGHIRRTPRCLDKPRRLEVFFPSLILGCYMGGEMGEPWYYNADKETRE